MPEEKQLTGGRTTTGVTRLGNTVRRPLRPNSEFVQALLAYLVAAGFEGAPKPLGKDEQGREVLSFIKGDVPAELGFFEDAILVEAARLIRRFHDATVGFFVSHGLDVICHNDLSPCNFVFRAGLPVAIIDFDAAAPGLRIGDLGYAAWLWCDLGNQAFTPKEQHRRLRLFVEAYGHMDVQSVVGAVILRQRMLEQLDNTAMSVWARACREWTQRYLLLR